MKHLIWIYLDHDRASFPHLDPVWVKERIRIFEQFTLASLKNQSFKDFEICLLCGQKNRSITEAHEWDPLINILYDKGRELISGIDDEFLAISRIDSDDLYHKHALEVIDQAAEISKDSKDMQGLIFRKNILWNRIYKFIAPHYRLCKFPPFQTKIYPRKLYKDWLQLSSTLFVTHGHARRFSMLDLPKHNVCVVKHGTNFGNVRRGRNIGLLTKEELESRHKKGQIFALDDKEVRETLSDFGMTDALIDEDPLIFKNGEFKHGR